MIRSHGVPRSTLDELRSLGLECADATCPFVAKIHNLAAQAAERGEVLLIAGTRIIRRYRGSRGIVLENILYSGMEKNWKNCSKIIRN